MSFVFPYDLIERGSKVALYGAGDVGKSFYMQINKMKYCSLSVWVDSSFSGYKKINQPFAKVDEIGKFEFDYLIIAITNKKIADEVKQQLLGKNIPAEKIVWSDKYIIKTNLWPMNKARVLENIDLFMDVIKKYEVANSIYGGGDFYQSFTELGIQGIRNTQERINLYKIKNFLNETSSVLNIGCNCGFLDLQVSPYIGNIVGIDIEPLFIEIAEEVREYLDIKNTQFVCGDFYSVDIDEKYDAIFSFAVHSNIMVSGASEQEYIDKIFERLNVNGYLFFESHDLKNERERYERLCKMFQDKGMSVCLHENYFSDFERDIMVLKKM